jgi:hypothetical protein
MTAALEGGDIYIYVYENSKWVSKKNTGSNKTAYVRI